MSRFQTVVLISFVATAVLSLWVLYAAGRARENSPLGYLAHIEQGHTDVGSVLRQRVGQLTEDRGATYAVDAVAAGYATKAINMDECHLLLHLIGHQAYRSYGPDFETIFSANHPNLCLGGYIHGVEAEIAATGNIQELKLFCALMKERHAANSPCFHGVGHSIFETTKDVKRSLAFCDSLAGGPEPDLSDCYRGVFSEIGNEMGGADTNTGLSTAPLEDVKQHIVPSHPYALCLSVESSYRDACYSQIAKLFYGDQRPLFGVAGCVAGSPTKAAQDICVSIVVALASRSTLDTHELGDVAHYVDALPIALQRAALSGAHQAYEAHFIGASTKPPWESLCTGLSVQSTRASCIKREFI